MRRLIIPIIIVVSVNIGYFMRKLTDNEIPTSTVKVEQHKPQQKDTTAYHFSDEFTDAQLREMVRSGHLKLR